MRLFDIVLSDSFGCENRIHGIFHSLIKDSENLLKTAELSYRFLVLLLEFAIIEYTEEHGFSVCKCVVSVFLVMYLFLIVLPCTWAIKVVYF